MDLGDKDAFLAQVTSVGNVLGTYIVCATKLETDNLAAEEAAKRTDPEYRTSDEMEAFKDAVREHLRTAYRDSPKEEIDTLLEMARDYLSYTVPAPRWNVEWLSKRIYLQELKRRMVVAVDYHTRTDESWEALSSVYSKGLGPDDYESQETYDAIIGWEFRYYAPEEGDWLVWLDDWEPRDYTKRRSGIPVLP